MLPFLMEVIAKSVASFGKGTCAVARINGSNFTVEMDDCYQNYTFFCYRPGIAIGIYLIHPLTWRYNIT